MFESLRKQWRDRRDAWRGLRAFEALPRRIRRIVFYAETAADWAFLAPVATSLEHHGERVVRVTSDPSDPALERADSFFVGFGSARTVLFRTMEADALVMTLPDLDTFHLKRSARTGHYFYIFHSIASTHRVYREHAFDAYDTIFCVGPHHLREIRRTEELYRLPAKRLIEHGYGRLDTIIADLGQTGAPRDSENAITRALIAPSWGESSLVRYSLEPLIRTLIEAGLHVTLRLHPMTTRHEPQLASALLSKYRRTGHFEFDPHLSATDSLLAADVMISEWSGAALEYAFARERPVIFIDTPPKTHNPNHASIGLPYLEDDIRREIGLVVSPESIATVPEAIASLVNEQAAWSARIRAARDRSVFNIGHSAEVAARAILDTLKPRQGSDG